MRFLEKNLEQIIFEADRIELIKRGLKASTSNIKRQLKIGNYGIADLISYHKETEERWDGDVLSEVVDSKPVITVFELKQECISVGAFLQAVRYAKGIKRYFAEKGYDHLSDCKFHLCLIGSTIDTDNSFVFLPDLISTEQFEVSFFTYHYELDGLRFQEHSGYRQTNEGFNI